MTPEELLNEVGEPVAWRFTAPGITKLDSWPHGGKWHGLYTSDQVAAAILKATGPLEEEIDRLESESEEYAQLQSRCFDGGGSHASVFDEVSELRAQLAAAQEEIAVLRKDAETYGPEKISLQKQAWLEADRQRQINDLKDQLAKAEQRVAEAIADYISSRVETDDDADLDVRDVALLATAGEIRSGEWRKFVKEV